MFAKSATIAIVLAALAGFSAAVPTADCRTSKTCSSGKVALVAPAAPVGSCSTGKVQCCNSVEHSTQPHVNNLLLGLEHFGLVKGLIGGLTGNVGIQCSPLLLSGNSCTAQTACCENVHFNGLIAVGCSPVNLSLL
ncbi:hypothetical protein PC9H_001965 [Pleurotus ostreatus]|uniref:Class I hydrophobin 15 n=2 Tax=Pleurotus ostreatus TaxID=5322 RepID=HYD15_PLEO1|nr:uncharacterized protein PC9H_001965 [Pleurotus ostreatus]KAF7419377.1 hypothetical protein PC9H_001965 [Pleurotus ostreatus]KAJ8689831.1 hypothetical protein PTI98_012693 [Pleurotus ostreatus]KDQ23321.1 hydrophobin 15 [Pleurotus ostreatus PC15]